MSEVEEVARSICDNTATLGARILCPFCTKPQCEGKGFLKQAQAAISTLQSLGWKAPKTEGES